MTALEHYTTHPRSSRFSNSREIRLTLCYFVCVMRKLEIHTTTVYIESFAQTRQCHGRAFDVPSRSSLAVPGEGFRDLQLECHTHTQTSNTYGLSQVSSSSSSTHFHNAKSRASRLPSGASLSAARRISSSGPRPSPYRQDGTFSP